MILRLSTANPNDEAVSEKFRSAVERVIAHDGQRPFSDQSIVDMQTGARQLLIAIGVDDDREPNTVLGYAIHGHSELEFFIAPEWREAGWGRAVLADIMFTAHGELLAWSHGDHPAARALAARFNFVPTRTLRQLVLNVGGPTEGNTRNNAHPDTVGNTGNDVIFGTFRPGVDDGVWVALNARIFSHHPEQGAITGEDLAKRKSEAWFDADNFFVARTSDGSLVGYNWLKVEPGSTDGEIYVIGVDPSFAGRGIARALMELGINRLRGLGVRRVFLYVEGNNTRAVNLYRSFGFVDHSADVQYRRMA